MQKQITKVFNNFDDSDISSSSDKLYDMCNVCTHPIEIYDDEDVPKCDMCNEVLCKQCAHWCDMCTDGYYCPGSCVSINADGYYTCELCIENNQTYH